MPCRNSSWSRFWNWGGVASGATDSFSKPSTSPTLNNPINRDSLLQLKAHAIFIQENLTPQDKAPMTQAYFTKHTVFLSSAGVGLIAAQWIRCTNPVARTDKLAFFRQQGRADIYNLDMGSSTALMVTNLHGWQGAASNGKSRKKTDELITAAQQEIDTTGMSPKIVLGDFNTDIDSSPAMRKLINEQGWNDVASLPAPINTQQNQPTCKAHGVRAATRRDFILANNLAVLAITSCNTNTQAAFDAHSPTAVQMSPKDFSPTVFTLKKPRSFEWQRLKTRCIQRISMERQDSGERPVDEQEIKIHEQQELEYSFRSHFAKVEHELQAALAYKNPDVFWRQWSSDTDDAIIQVCAHGSSERRHYTGHGNATYILRKHKASKVFQACSLLHQSH